MEGEVKMQHLNIKMEIFKEDDSYVALCPSLNVSSFGETMEEAKASLVEAVEAFVEECAEMGTLEEILEESGYVRTDQDWLPRQAVSEERVALPI
jgi:predicted RNase H-like HicB family nuclease